MKKTVLSLVLLGAGLFTTLNAQQIAKGIVFEDKNFNNKFDKSEQRLANIQVSNGQEVVSTNEKGEYQINVTCESILFVIKPTNYKVPVNENNQPKFYYINKSNGSPKLDYAGSSPTGDLPSSIDFALISSKENQQFSALIFGDPQAYTEEEMHYFAKGIIEDVKGIKGMEFGLSLGDLVGDDLNLHPSYTKTVGKVGLPWYNVMGNHDMNYDAKEDIYSDETFEKNFGPNNYSYNVGKAHFIVLDDILYPDPRDGKGYWAGFRDDQLEFIKNDLKFVPKDYLIVLAFHIPLREIRTEDRNKLFELLKDYPNTVSMSAHTHYQEQIFYKNQDGWQQQKPHHEYNVGTTSGDWYSGPKDANGVPASTMRDGTPKGYAFLHVDGNQYKFEYKVANNPKERQIDLYHTKKVKEGKRNQAYLFANFFMGHQSNKVEYRVNNGEWKAMEWNPSVDYNYMNTLIKIDNSEITSFGRRPSAPEISQHVWSVRLPNKLTAGTYQIEVRARDLYGNTFTEKSSYEVIK
jgi:3',5'-cyclic AMP phosphodiesterase CpdA